MTAMGELESHHQPAKKVILYGLPPTEEIQHSNDQWGALIARHHLKRDQEEIQRDLQVALSTLPEEKRAAINKRLEELNGDRIQ